MENALLRKLITKYSNNTDTDYIDITVHLANYLPVSTQSFIIEEMIADYYKLKSG